VLDGSLIIPEKTFVNADARYNFKLGGQAASLRLWFENIFNRRSWDTNSGGRYLIHGNSGRHIDLRLIVDM
jgi:outer membrane receptor protein involved in Fe transport